ncbi:hypothetical protein BKP64_11000 [Marinobacter salinus]|uniref:Lipoprotein SmpA/OmlA domain-containing protein n=1 Tax=Marinobacter salinus TaxID=1874317 RepID=A0A1D9GLY9_9GAMM|nr:hypothetical protein [Marinobacter salinus]AOY88656.1 hypothetical protein BKP64_11000 [Marinobacter salinus]
MKQLILLALLALSGCVTQMGQPIDQQKMVELEEGETTKEQAIAAFGPPMNLVQGSNGKQILMWMHGNAGIWGAQKSQSLSITFDEDGVLESYFSSNMEPPNR